jgi:ElaB/YqjD/DUF883 family membrane-anchored ribosome-binding protein
VKEFKSIKTKISGEYKYANMDKEVKAAIADRDDLLQELAKIACHDCKHLKAHYKQTIERS